MARRNGTARKAATAAPVRVGDITPHTGVYQNTTSEEKQPKQHTGSKLFRGVAGESAYRSVATHPAHPTDTSLVSFEFSAVLKQNNVTAASVVNALGVVRRLLTTLRWTPHAFILDEGGWNPQATGRPAVALSLNGAVKSCGNDQLVYFATEDILRKLTGEPLVFWERHPLRTLGEVLALIDKARSLLGWAKPPQRGGWQISQPRSNT